MYQLTKTELELYKNLNNAYMGKDGIAALAFLTLQVRDAPFDLNFGNVFWFENPDFPIEGPISIQDVLHEAKNSEDQRIAMYARVCSEQHGILWYYMDGQDPKETGPVTYDFVNGLSDEALRLIALSAFTEEKDSTETSTPDSLCTLARQLLAIGSDDTVADLCSGKGRFLSYITGNGAYGFEINSDLIGDSIGLCAVNLSYPSFEQRDVLTLEGRKFDRVFCEYPWGTRYERPLQTLSCENWKPLSVKDLKRSMLSWLFIAKALSLTANDGITVVHANDGALFSTYESDIRKEAVEKGLLKAVIKLPANMMRWTGIPSSLLVFGRGNKEVRFIDASKLGDYDEAKRIVLSIEDINKILMAVDGTKNNEFAASVPVDEIIARGSILLPSAYLNPEERNVQIRDGKTIEELGTEIIRSVVSNSRYLTKEAVSEYRVLSSSDIADGRVDVSSLPYLTKEGVSEISGKALASVLIDGDVVMTNKSTVIKTAVVETNGEKILLFGSLYGLRIKREIMNPEYLCAFINSAVGQNALRTIQTGTVISMITVANLNTFVVPCPPMAEQDRFAENIAVTLEMIQDAKSRIAKLQKQLAGSFDFLATEDE